MKKIALIAVVGALCLCIAGCGSAASQAGSSSGASPSSGQSPNAASDTLSVGEEVDVEGSIILVTSEYFVVDCSGVHFQCNPADPKTLNYITAGNAVEIEGIISSFDGDTVNLDNVTIDDYSDGYKDIDEHFEHPDDHHDDAHHVRS